MIKKTFYNLPNEKKERIINAVKQEFSKHTKEKVSINKIVQNANISRGSFYQYFDDKTDLIQLLTGDVLKKIADFAKIKLPENDGNVFLFYIDIFDEITNIINKSNDCNLFKNLFANLKVNGDLISDFLQNRFPTINEDESINEHMDQYINPIYLNCRKKSEIVFVINILNLVLKNSIFNIFVKQDDPIIEREIFIKKVDLLKNGLATDLAR